MLPKVLVVLLTVIHGPADRVIMDAASEAIRAAGGEGSGLGEMEVPTEAAAAKKVAEALRETPAVAGVMVLCKAPACARVTLKVTQKGGQPLVRELSFKPGDAPKERGRRIGVLAATLLPAAWSGRGADAGAPRDADAK
jgi:hypothetical protein